MNPTPEILHLARQLRDQAEPLIDQPDSLVYRLAAAHLLHAPYETTRRLNREIIGSLRDDLVLEYLIYSLERGENPHPNTRAVLPLLHDAMYLLREDWWKAKAKQNGAAHFKKANRPRVYRAKEALTPQRQAS